MKKDIKSHTKLLAYYLRHDLVWLNTETGDYETKQMYDIDADFTDYEPYKPMLRSLKNLNCYADLKFHLKGQTERINPMKELAVMADPLTTIFREDDLVVDSIFDAKGWSHIGYCVLLDDEKIFDFEFDNFKKVLSFEMVEKLLEWNFDIYDFLIDGYARDINEYEPAFKV